MAIIVMFLAGATAEAESTRCEKLQAEAEELAKNQPAACDEARETHARFVQSLQEIMENCKRLEAETSAGPATLKEGTPVEMRAEIIALKQKHMGDRQRLVEHFAHELLRTPVDIDDPARAPAEVSSECGTELEGYARYRRSVLRGISEFYRKLEELDDSLLNK